ncbi:hypothetical protein QO058_30200 (plasmid) [Bosea vestrisii]|uniref:hypothetical protein n=1 Tax=Bosea vestrisii TaxID=151416 RepID=UPI0024DF614C|nr:hypothetical protein [Bosea vestrisii]WID99675.1 hypothetical protein QO058_30200 [Bosea vestrisii]
MFSLRPPPAIIRSLTPLDGVALRLMLTGLLLEPAFLANHARILTLLHWTLVLAKGRRPPTKNDLTVLFAAMSDHSSFSYEDPAEDVFVDIVWTPQWGLRIFPGMYTGVGFHLQRLLDTAEQAGDDVADISGVRDVVALLRLSESLAARRRLEVGAFAESEPGTQLRPNVRRAFKFGSLALFRAEELDVLSIEREQLNRFVLQPTRRLLEQPFGGTDLDHFPLIECEDGLQVLSPSGLANAAVAHLVFSLGPSHAETLYQRDLVRWLGVDLPRARAKPLPGRELGLPDPGWSRSIKDRALALEFDHDKHAHLLLLEAKWPESREDAELIRLGGGRALAIAVSRLVAQLHETLEEDSVSDAGLSLVVHNSPGWGLEIGELPDIGPKWFVVTMSAYSFSMLLRAPGFELLKLWKMLAELRELMQRGTIIKLWPDPLVYWSVWENFGFTFAPALADMRGTAFIGDTTLLAPLIRRIREAWHTHGVRTPWGEIAVVERYPSDDGTSPDLQIPVYHDHLAISGGTLLGAIENEHGPWWVSVGRPPFSTEDRQFLGLLWQAVLEWLTRAAAGATKRLSAAAKPLLVTLLPIPTTITDGPDNAQFFYCPDGSEVRIMLPADLMERMVRVDNEAEIQVLAWVLEGILTLRGETATVKPMAWAREILANPDLKMIHITHGVDQAFAIDLTADKTRYRPLQEHDLATAGRWMDERLTVRGDLTVAPPMTLIGDAVQVNTILNAAVDVHWEACRDRLSTLDRSATLRLVLGLIEATHRHRVDDERGARARRIAYADDPQLGVRRANQRDQAFRTYRVVAEMALCACPLTSGRPPGLSDIDAIAAQVAALVRMAEFSDAAQRKLVKGELTFLPNGSILPYGGGAEEFMTQYLHACLEESVTLDEEGYSNLYDTPQDDTEWVAGHEDDLLPPDIEAEDNGAFENAVLEEIGLTILAVATIAFALQSIAGERSSEVTCLRQSALTAAVIEMTGRLGHAVTSSEIDRFIAAFGLPTRSAWDKPPPDFTANDIFPWFYERRLSLMTRPLLVLSGEDDPEIMFGVRQVRMGSDYAMLLLEMGIWDKARLRSPAAKEYMDTEVARRGRAFEDKIASIFAKGGWTPHKSIPMARFGASKKLGEIDVLAVSANGKTWVVVECKWFGAARTPREVAAWMQDFHGRDGDKLHKHLQRCDWIEANSSIVAQRLGLAPPERILKRLVTTRPAPLAYVHELPTQANVRTERQLQKEFGSGSAT